MLNNRFVAIAIAIFCIPLGIVTTLQIEHLQPEWVHWAVRWLLALTAGLSWAGGIAISFYLRALYGNSVPLLLIGGLGMGAFYGTYYTGTAGAWFGPAYAALTAAFDFLWLERVLHCVGVAQKGKSETDNRLTLLKAETDSKVAILKAEAGMAEARAKERKAEASKVKAEKAETNLPTVKRQKPIPFPTKTDTQNVSFLDFMAEWQGRGTERGFVPEYARQNNLSVDTVYKWARRAREAA